MKIINVPIESLEERYSKQWNIWFPRAFNNADLNFVTVDPPSLTHKIRQGAFLDVVGTNYYKASQLKQICYQIDQGFIESGDIFFFHDLWFPGIEMLAYIRDALMLDFKICGIFHAGTYDKHDFLFRMGMAKWGARLERSWGKFIDLVFVATEFHKDLLCRKRGFDRDKVRVTGLPIYPDFVFKTSKDNIIVFPHRLDPEKNPSQFRALEKVLSSILPKWSFVLSKEKFESKNKKGYYHLLNVSNIAISFSDQETWGIAMIESVMSGCIPLVPDRLSYQELYPRIFRFSSFRDCLDKIIDTTKNPDDYQKAAEMLKKDFIGRGKSAIPLMIHEMKTL